MGSVLWVMFLNFINTNFLNRPFSVQMTFPWKTFTEGKGLFELIQKSCLFEKLTIDAALCVLNSLSSSFYDKADHLKQIPLDTVLWRVQSPHSPRSFEQQIKEAWSDEHMEKPILNNWKIHSFPDQITKKNYVGFYLSIATHNSRSLWSHTLKVLKEKQHYVRILSSIKWWLKYLSQKL